MPGPRLERPFTYCEVGCGMGETANLLAAANPTGRFLGIDLNARQVEQARRASEAAGLSNAEFLAADIATVDLASLPDFDYITLHGVYAWVPPPVQRAIEELLAHKLKPAGVAYVSYNAMPGWGAVAPMRRAFAEHARRSGKPPLDAARAALDYLLDLQEADAPFFRENPTAAHVLARLRTADIRYVAHEYLAEHWRPLYFAEMLERMTRIGLEFVGDGAVIENLLEHSVPDSLAERLRRQPDQLKLESERDFLQNRFFRRDIYVRPSGQARIEPDALLKDTLFGMTVSPVQVPDTIRLPGDMRLTFEGAWFDRIKQLLAYRALTGEELCNDPALARIDDAELLAGVEALSIGGFLAPFARREAHPPREPAETIALLPRINASRLDEWESGSGVLLLASPVTGSAIALEPLEAILLGGLRFPGPLLWAEREIERREIEIRRQPDGQALSDPAARRAALENALDTFCRVRLPKLAYLGVVAPGD